MTTRNGLAEHAQEISQFLKCFASQSKRAKTSNTTMAAVFTIKRWFAIAALLLFNVQYASSNDFVRIGGVLYFNAVNETCTSAEDRSIIRDMLKDFIDLTTLNQVFPRTLSRKLRLGSRKLTTQCKLCGRYCFFGATNSCPRRRLQRHLGVSGECMENRLELEQMLAETVQEVSRASCRALLKSRVVKCYDQSQLCQVVNVALEGSKVVDPMKKTAITTFSTTQQVTFRADTIYANGEVTFLVRNVSDNAIVANRTQTTHPFYYLGSKTATTTFAVGNYTMEVIPGFDHSAAFKVPFSVSR